MANYKVVYDACVLYPATIRDFLVELATQNPFKAYWTNDIQEEWISNLLQNRPDLSRERLERTAEVMNSSVSDCLVTGYEDLIPSLKLPDANDRHVLAAAIRCGADAIITFNLSDFPESELIKYDIEAQHPDDFIVNQIGLNSNLVCRVAELIIGRLKNPPMTK